jgi:hypothetical protein
MNDDAYERRALLLNLCNTLQTLSRIFESERTDQTIGELIVSQFLLTCRCSSTVRNFTAAALHAFCRWPQRLLDDPLDRIALATSVRDHLFESNPEGWEAYAAALRTQVPWFGESPPPMNR